MDEFKGNEIAKKVTTSYERCYEEIQKVMEQKVANKDIGSLYTYLLDNKSGEINNLGKRLLLDTCFLQETKQRVNEMERASGVMAKIEEKAASKPSWYPTGRMWLDEQDTQQLQQFRAHFQERHMAYLLQSLVFEKMVETDLKEASGLTEWHLRRHLEAFRDPQLTLNKASPNKMMYDSIRILGLITTSSIDRTLVLLHNAPQDGELKSKLVRMLICFCHNSMQLKPNDNHLHANICHLQYSIAKFSDLIIAPG